MNHFLTTEEAAMSPPEHEPQPGDLQLTDPSSSTMEYRETPGGSNVFNGIVISRAEGLTRTTLRVRIGERTILRVRWLGRSAAHDALDVRQPVRVVIPEEAVQIEVGGFRRGKQRWNRWIGHVVLAYHSNHDPVTTVKIHHTDMTLRSRGPVIGACEPLMTLDSVNVVVDPQHVWLTPLRQTSGASCDSDPVSDSDPPSASLWLQATVRSLRSTQDAQHVALDVGIAKVAVLIQTTGGSVFLLNAGASVQVSIGHGGAWIRRDADSTALPCCVSHSSEFDDL